MPSSRVSMTTIEGVVIGRGAAKGKASGSVAG
jgi:hypothetical protein